MSQYLAKVLSMGPVPNHVAFIVDGNRRWARERHLEVTKGHEFGAKNGESIVRFIEALGVKEVTMYAFSIENFKRPKKEVDTLMKMLNDALLDALDQVPTARLRVIGNKSLLPKEIQEKLSELEESTKECPGIIFNVAMAYTCRQDITQGIKTVLENDRETQNVTVDTIRDSMYTCDVSDVDILVRTSGETRVSDFLMWESSNAWLCFIDRLWPDLRIWDVTRMILQYQRMVFNKELPRV